MPASVDWENAEKTIIRQRLMGDWTFEEYMASARQTQAMTGSVSHTVHVIIDFSESQSHPTKMLAAGTTLDRNFPANQGLLFSVQCPPYIRALFEVMSKLYPKIGQNSFEVHTVEEALAIIQAREADV